MDQRFRANFERSPNLQDILSSYKSAQEALADGNHYIALLKARAENEKNVENAALIMCGAIQKGLNGLKPGIFPQEAYGHWCLGNKVTASNILKDYQGFKNLRRLLRKSVIKILILCGPHTKHYVPSKELREFQIFDACVERDETAPPLSQIMPSEFHPDAIIILDIYGHRVPNDLYNFDGPVIFLNYDFDVQLPLQFQDLQRADLIVGNGAYEHYVLHHIYKTPVSVFPALVLPFHNNNMGQVFDEKDIDFLHTGLSFTPTMREKAQFLFRIATIDDPDLNIRIHHGSLDYQEYLSQIRRSKFMPIFNGRMYGGIQSRTIDAILNGSIAFHGSEDVAAEIFETGQLSIRNSSSAKLEEDVTKSLATYPGDWQTVTKNYSKILAELGQFFLKPIERDARFLKYCLFEVARFNHGRKSGYTFRTTSVTGLDRCLELARRDKKNGQSLYSLGLFRAIEACIASPLDPNKRTIVETFFSEASPVYPNSLAMLFNYARFKWMVGDKDQAYATFEIIIDGLISHYFDPTRDLVWLKLFENASEMMPPQDYFLSVTNDIVSGDSNNKYGRAVIATTALSYMALHHLQKEDFKSGLEYLEKALDLYPNHFPAARLKFKALHAIGEDYETVSKAFNNAVKLYPPSLTDLLPFGVSNELAQNNEVEALSLVKTWAYFITRCTWDRDTSHKIPELTWKTVRAFFYRLPIKLQNRLKESFSEISP